MHVARPAGSDTMSPDDQESLFQKNYNDFYRNVFRTVIKRNIVARFD